MNTSLPWQLYDDQDRPLTVKRSIIDITLNAHLHGSAHVWIWRKESGTIELLFQTRRGSTLKWPYRRDKSAGGHIYLGEEPLEAAIRKTRQELGLALSPKNLSLGYKIHVRAPVGKPGTPFAEFTENELQWVYLAHIPNIDSLISISACIEWLPLDGIKRALARPECAVMFAPYGLRYYAKLFEAVESDVLATAQ